MAQRIEVYPEGCLGERWRRERGQGSVRELSRILDWFFVPLLQHYHFFNLHLKEECLTPSFCVGVDLRKRDDTEKGQETERV